MPISRGRLLLPEINISRSVPDLIKQFFVRYELRSNLSPLYEYIDGSKVQLGWELEIAGTCFPWQPFQTLDADRDRQAGHAVCQFAQWLLSEAATPASEIIFVPRKTYFWTQHGNRPDKIVTIEIRTPPVQSKEQIPSAIKNLEDTVAGKRVTYLMHNPLNGSETWLVFLY